jgi:hypothetical protein
MKHLRRTLGGPRAPLILTTAIGACSATPPAPSRQMPQETREAVAPVAALPDAGATSYASSDLLNRSAAVIAPPRPGVFANLDPLDDLVVGPPEALADCEGDLKRAGVSYRLARLPVHTERRSAIVCGAPQVVTYLHGPGKITYSSPPLLTCSMALALAWFEGILQTEADRIFHSPVAKVEQLGTYNCREMAAYPGWVSEHAYANAIDIAHFTLRSGVEVDVLRDFDIGEAPPLRHAGEFLRVVSRRANDEDVFSHGLTPFFDAHHKNHFHLDLARYRADGTRPHED